MKASTLERLQKALSALYLCDKAIQLAVPKLFYEREFKPLIDELRAKLERHGVVA